MRRPRYHAITAALPRMTWNPANLFNLWQRSVGPHAQNKVMKNLTTFNNYPGTLFKSRWQSKKLVRAYHCDYIPEKKFVRWWLPDRLPDPMQRKHAGSKEDAAKEANTRAAVAWARHETAPKSRIEESELAPISSLMFSELERRIDVVIFRSCFATSIHSARQMVVHGWVTLNGLKESNPNVRLNPGDLISVDPAAMTILHPAKIPTTAELGSSAESEGVIDTSSGNALEALADLETSETPTTHSTEESTSPYSQSSVASSISLSKTSSPPKLPNHIFANEKTNAPFSLPRFASPFIFIPAYLEVSFATCSTIYLRHPTARPGYSEIPTPYDADGEIVRFAWEWYMKHRPRIRGWKRKLRDTMEKGKSGWNGIAV